MHRISDDFPFQVLLVQIAQASQKELFSGRNAAFVLQLLHSPKTILHGRPLPMEM